MGEIEAFVTERGKITIMRSTEDMGISRRQDGEGDCERHTLLSEDICLCRVWLVTQMRDFSPITLYLSRK